MSDQLVEIGCYPSSAEAAMVRGRLEDAQVSCHLAGEATAGWLWHLGSAISGVRLLVHEDDLPVARKVLQELSKDLAESEVQWPEEEFGEGKDAHTGDAIEGTDEAEEMDRAWKAAVIGIGLLPPLLNVYSMCILVKHRFFAPRHTHWRVISALAFNLLVFAVLGVLVAVIVAPPAGMEVHVGPPPLRDPSPQPAEIPAKSVEETDQYPLVPSY